VNIKSNHLFKLRIILCLLIFLEAGCATPPKSAIASAHPLASQAGFEILDVGGNAFDAAVAVSAALAVVEPSGSGLGGGGFWLLHRASDGKQVMIDGRERAPMAATRGMFLDANGNFDQSRSLNGALAAGIPGMPAAIVHMAEKYGELPIAQSLGPAIRYAREGFLVDEGYLRLIAFRAKVMKQYPSAASIFLHNKENPKPPFRLQQTDLANTLEQIGKRGKAGFYQGSVGQALVAGVRSAGGIWTRKDLQDYAIVERKPVIWNYKGIKITSAAPPSSGGVVLTEALNILSAFDLANETKINRKHLIIESMRRAYRDRARYLGDPDYIQMPLPRLLSAAYAEKLRSDIRIDHAGFASETVDTAVDPVEGQNTTHFSVLDKAGNRVSATLSINYPFGSCLVAKGTGVLLNDEMDDFVGQKGSPNTYGLTGGEANAIEPGKRMLSSMTPTFLEDSERVAILGTPGGSRIISMVLLAILDFSEGHDVDSWVAVPRFHHQYEPDLVQYEKGGLSYDEIQLLEKKGHKFKEIKRHYGNMQAILWNKRNQSVTAASDPRKYGMAIVR